MPEPLAVKTQADIIPKNAIAKIFVFIGFSSHQHNYTTFCASNKASLNGKLREANVPYAGGFYHVLGNLGAEYDYPFLL